MEHIINTHSSVCSSYKYLSSRSEVRLSNKETYAIVINRRDINNYMSHREKFLLTSLKLSPKSSMMRENFHYQMDMLVTDNTGE